MARLIIIGNGYDMSRLRGATSYKKFGKWLCKQYNLRIRCKNTLPDVNYICAYPGAFFKSIDSNFPNSISKEIDEKRNNFFATLLVNMIQELGDKNWNNFENDLANLRWLDYIEEDSNLDSKRSLGSPVSHRTEVITSAGGAFNSLFSDWVSSINYKSFKKRYFEKQIERINRNDTILIFNYTDTFERIFNLEPNDSRVCHIHGNATDKSSIVVGHGCFSKSNLSNMDNIIDYIQDVEAVLYKNTEKIIKQNQNTWGKIAKDFAKGLSNEIWVYGWQGKEADEPYLKKIIQIVNNSERDCTLFLNNYKCYGNKNKELWENNGFSGEIQLYKEKTFERIIEKWF